MVSWFFSSHMMFIRGLVFGIAWVFSIEIYYLNKQKIPPIFNFGVKRNNRHVKSEKEIGLKYLSSGSMNSVGEKPRWLMPVMKLHRVAESTVTSQSAWRNFTVGGNCQGPLSMQVERTPEGTWGVSVALEFGEREKGAPSVQNRISVEVRLPLMKKNCSVLADLVQQLLIIKI